MRCEVVAIGTELLLGQITDTNSSWIGEQLALAGIDSFFQTKVGDNLDRIVDAIELALGDLGRGCRGAHEIGRESGAHEGVGVRVGVRHDPDRPLPRPLRCGRPEQFAGP